MTYFLACHYYGAYLLSVAALTLLPPKQEVSCLFIAAPGWERLGWQTCAPGVFLSSFVAYDIEGKQKKTWRCGRFSSKPIGR